ncbi:probable G-protein coupled receptor Mth-like 14 isoform X2 [Anopheles bellator]|uniref:probable G-protein coupled receptor Mth-like 14 isoform X2 n=1 Tax=Anopheles bellator TaxID=139047 RepID=UPI00264A3B37|nr:probable G-protein coupled receptor Mth-like 14 isoform X2 [Anopheles bellator]
MARSCVVIVYFVLLCGVWQHAASGFEDGSGLPKETYEEYDDDTPYHRPIEHPSDEGDYDDVEPPDNSSDPAPEEPPVRENPSKDSDLHSVSPVSVRHDFEPSDSDRAVDNKTTLGPIMVPSAAVLLEAASTMKVFEMSTTTSSGSSSSVTPSGSSEMPATSVTGEDENNCKRYQKLANQPVFRSETVNVIRKCCPIGERLLRDGTKYVDCGTEDFASGPMSPTFDMRPIVAQFYDGCIEDLEEDIQLSIVLGDPCPMDRGLLAFGAKTNDTLYVIQNGSLLVIFNAVEEFHVYNAYCLDYDARDGSMLAYVCVSEVELLPDVIAGQLVMLTLCLIIAVPLLLVTAILYTIVPELNDIHGKALAMNCVNFAVALLLETFFQHRTHGKRADSDEIVLESYAEYFILATFFWLMVNLVNNCLHAWYFLPRDRDQRGEKIRFAIYAAVAQLVPLWIISRFAPNAHSVRVVKNYFFITIIITLILNTISLFVTIAGLRRVIALHHNYKDIRHRLIAANRTSEISSLPKIQCDRLNKVIYINKYTTLLFLVMATVWIVTSVTYYTTGEIPIFFDILFGFQGIFIFLIFVCMRKPFRAVQNWFFRHGYCTSCCYNDGKPQSPNNRREPMMMARSVPNGEPVMTVLQPLMMSPARSISTTESIPCTPGGAESGKRRVRSKNPFMYVAHEPGTHHAHAAPE